jgi:hypothetical protein
VSNDKFVAARGAHTPARAAPAIPVRGAAVYHRESRIPHRGAARSLPDRRLIAAARASSAATARARFNFVAGRATGLRD